MLLWGFTVHGKGEVCKASRLYKLVSEYLGSHAEDKKSKQKWRHTACFFRVTCVTFIRSLPPSMCFTHITWGSKLQSQVTLKLKWQITSKDIIPSLSWTICLTRLLWFRRWWPLVYAWGLWISFRMKTIAPRVRWFTWVFDSMCQVCVRPKHATSRWRGPTESPFLPFSR